MFSLVGGQTAGLPSLKEAFKIRRQEMDHILIGHFILILGLGSDTLAFLSKCTLE